VNSKTRIVGIVFEHHQQKGFLGLGLGDVLVQRAETFARYQAAGRAAVERHDKQ